MTIELAAIFLKLNHDHNHAQLEGREVLRILQWQERGAQAPPMTGSEPGLEASERTSRVWDDIAKRHSGDGVALFCIINEVFRLNNS